MEKNFDRKLMNDVSLEAREESNELQKEISKKLYLGEIIDIEKPKFENNNLILAPVGSGKSFLIEEKLIPKDYKGKVLYLTSNTALRDSLAPQNSELRKEFAKKGKSKGFFTSSNKESYGDVPYKVHVMTYHEFGKRIFSPNETFTEDFNLIFCDEIHSLPIFTQYGGNGELLLVLKWIFKKHENKTIYYFTATKDSIDKLERKVPGYTQNTKMFNYLNHDEIVQYKARSTYFIQNTNQLRFHLQAKFEYINYYKKKGLAFTRKIDSQEKIKKIAEEEGYKPIVLWSINNKDNEMSEEQLNARDYLLNTGNIPLPYNLLIINGSMQEGWNLHDKNVEFAVLDTVDKTEQVQALGRIRKDIDFLLLKVSGNDKRVNSLVIDEKFLNRGLFKEEKDRLVEELDIKSDRGRRLKWPSIKKMLINSGYEVKNSTKTIDGERVRLVTITVKNLM